jgi:peroxiredoxin Q/BCP
MSKLKKGRKAPAFTAQDQDGNTISLADFLGKKVALYFYPKDDTPTCTDQACNLRDNIALLKQHNIVVLGVSADTSKSHKKFEKKFTLPFPLLADEDMKIIKAYDVWGEKVLFGREYMGIIRTTFLINEDGKIGGVIDKVVSKNHAQQILDMWKLK